jgi:hypothetical protein
MIARLSRVILTVRGSEGVASAVEFYHKCIGLQVWRVTDDWAELVTPIATNNKPTSNKNTDNMNVDDIGRIIINIQAVHTTESQLSVGYSPIITFQVDHGTMDSTITSCVQSGAHLDGPIQYPAYGKVAALRSPQGHMIGLYEPNM